MIEILKALKHELSVNGIKKESFTFILNLETNCPIQNKMHLLEIKGKEMRHQQKIMKNLYQFYSNIVAVSTKGIFIYLFKRN